MTIVIDVPAELERRLETEAERRGVSKDEFVRMVLEDELKPLPNGSDPSLQLPRILARNLPVRDRSREGEWLAQHRDDYAGKWVALDGDSVIASGDDLSVVVSTARERGAHEALIVLVEVHEALPFAGF